MLFIYGAQNLNGASANAMLKIMEEPPEGVMFADGRVDFRELVKDLAGIFHTRIELRQIGVRDESKMIGGLGICGQPFCCSRFLKDFQPVSIKMAKEQGLSLNPTKISGACGRLMCCLAYEESAYEYLNSIMPMVGSTVRTPDGLGTVLEVNPVSGYLRVRCGTEALTPRYYKVGVCEYISGGKRAPRRPDPDDDYSGVRNPAPVVASSDDEKRPACPRRRARKGISIHRERFSGKGLLHMVSGLALSGANAPALPKGEPLAVPADFISLPRPLPLGEVDLRSKDGEGEQAKVKVSANKC